jgi:hypothetical protein
MRKSRKPDAALNSLAKRVRLTVIAVGVLSLAINAALSLFGYMPQPEVHDEFSYLLAADTFAHGRLANPVHPLWVHFESIHINQLPTYASMYPPGQGFFLAVGQVITGYPIVGAWIGVAFGCGAVAWMLFAWIPPRWAMLGGVLAAFHPLVLEWGQNYWGGGVAMGGGALVLGAFRRLIPVPRSRDAVIMGIGIAVLANTRPYEGFVLSGLLCAVFGIYMLTGGRPDYRTMLKSVALPMFAVLLPVAIWMGYYNYRVVGKPLLMPRLVNHHTYMMAPVFLWQEPAPQPHYRHRAMRDFHVGWEMSDYLAQRSLLGRVSWGWDKATRLAGEYARSWGLAVPLIVLPWVFWRDRWMRIAVLLLAFFAVALLLVVWVLAHYAAPVMGLFLVVSLECMRFLSAWRWRGKSIGRWVTGTAIGLCFLSGVLACSKLVGKRTAEPSFGTLRAHILSRLEQTGGKHLILVRYRPDHNPHLEWVYNAADIDRAPIVWAREMDTDQNAKLLEYFKGRHVWLFEADELRISPFR